MRTALGVLLCLFTLAEVNYPYLRPQSQLAIFAGLGLVLCFLTVPLGSGARGEAAGRARDLLEKIQGPLLAAASALVAVFLVTQAEPAFESLWLGGRSLGDRAALEGALDVLVGSVGLLLVLEAARRTVGWALPILATTFLAYAAWGSHLPGWLFPHRGYSLERIVSQAYLHSQGVYGTALRVMFVYVFLFVLFGAILEATGATRFIIGLARRAFRNSSGGAAKVSVLASGLMGSLSGSAVANTATTGTFTIPMMKSSGFRAATAGGVEAAASSGGALVPPVMGAGAYMMLEIIDPPVTYLEILRAALIPALLYYLSLFLIVHFRAKRIAWKSARTAEATAREAKNDAVEIPKLPEAASPFAGVLFVLGFASLLTLLVLGFTPFRAVTLALVAVVFGSLFQASTRLTPGTLIGAFRKTARDVVPLISAAACVGIVLGVVTLTGVGTKLPAALLPLAEQNLLLALVALMVSSIVLGLGLPSAVCYLLLATLVGPALSQLGVVPLAAHFFIFYFGMMSMVTPPVALAAYTAASIAGSKIMETAFAAFRFALVGFTLPFMFVFRPELLLLDAQGGTASWSTVLPAVVIAVLGILAFSSAIAGCLARPLTPLPRGLLFLAAALLLIPGPSIALGRFSLPVMILGGLLLLPLVALINRRANPSPLVTE